MVLVPINRNFPLQDDKAQLPVLSQKICLAEGLG